MKKRGSKMKPKIPKPLTIEHKELHEKLGEIIQEGGKIGEAAKAVAEVLHPHFAKEEKYALPPLGVLRSLIKGKAQAQTKEILRMSDELKKDLPTMLKEHKEVVAGLKTLIAEALKEERQDVILFAEKLILHAETEDEVFYPAAILVGEYLKRANT